MAVASAVAVDFGGGPGGFGMLPTGIASFQLFFDVTTAASDVRPTSEYVGPHYR